MVKLFLTIDMMICYLNDKNETIQNNYKLQSSLSHLLLFSVNADSAAQFPGFIGEHTNIRSDLCWTSNN